MKWDPSEAYRLDRDATALMEELVGPPDPEPLIVGRLRAQLDGDTDREEAIYTLMRRREHFWRAVGGLYELFALGMETQDLVTVRQAHAGLRALTIREFSEDHRGGVQDESS